jgi:hypothetical protein
MPAAAEVRCTGCETRVIVFCETRVIVFPSTLYGLVADDTGVWTCPECRRSSIVPVVDFN